MRFSKWHAHGNVYLLAEDGGVDAAAVPELAAGTDGIVEVLEHGRDWADVAIWNPDGSTAELSGNGTRMAARWLADVGGAETVRIRVRGGREVTARALPDGRIETDMGEVTVGPRDEVAGVVFVPVDVGNPHAVVEADPSEIARIGPLLETHPRFPSRTNVQVVRVERPGEVTARVWERGVGETQSSGTSAVAVAAATHAGGSGRVVVHFPGGDLEVDFRGGRAYLTGPAERIAP